MVSKRTFIIACALTFSALARPGATAASTDRTVEPNGIQPISDQRTDATDMLREQIRRQLAIRYPGAKIDLTGPIRWAQGGLSPNIAKISILGDSHGDAQFAFEGGEGFVTFAAWVPARIAVRRIHPGEKLSDEMFATQETNVAAGQAFEFRGVILPTSQVVSGLETRQTIVEGQLLTSTAVQKVPDLRRGDMVRIKLSSGDLTLTTVGTAEEPAYFDSRVRVMTSKGKRELVGKLKGDGIVEVSL